MTPSFAAQRVLLEESPFVDFTKQSSAAPWEEGPRWPCSWVRLKDVPLQPFVAAYRVRFSLETARRFRVHVTGDERYEFFVNDERVGRGPSRAPRGRWYYESYEVELPAGEHIFGALVTSLGKFAPWAQTSYGHGWLLAPEPEDLWDLIGTGRGGWEAKVLPGYHFTSASKQMGKHLGCGAMLEVEKSRPSFSGMEDWALVETSFAGNNGVTLYFRESEPLLHPTPLPTPYGELISGFRLRDAWSGSSDEPFPAHFGGQFTNQDESLCSGLFQGQSISVAPHQKLRLLLDFENYVAAYPTLAFTLGSDAVVRLGWSESLVGEAGQKGNRNWVTGRRWSGLHDTFRPDGGLFRHFETLWWRCGRYLLLEVETGAERLEIERLELEETRYPLDVAAEWKCGDESWEELFGLCQRALESCMHETYMDCPFYEQLQYLGDTRLQMLLTYVLSGDDRLARQALTAFALAQRNPTGWMPSNHPSSEGQCIPPFTLWWVAMLHDFGRWRSDKAFVKSLLPTARNVVELWLQKLSDNGLVATPEGWNFVDSVGHLLDIQSHFSGALNWHLAYTLRLLGELEEWCGEGELAARMQRLAQNIAQKCEVFWDSSRQLYTDDKEHSLFSEQTNCLALLSGCPSPQRRAELEKSLFGEQEMVRCSIYFSHYLFEAAATSGRFDVIEKRLEPWLGLAEQGFVTTPETFGGTRSDCHAWGAHPLFHYYTSVLGIMPSQWGFERVLIKPQLSSLPWAKGKMAHPLGELTVELKRESDEVVCSIVLPEGVSGLFVWGETQFELSGGQQEFRVDA